MINLSEDSELRALFHAESLEHLQQLEQGLLHLESEPEDRALMEELFRSAHTLKGSAAMVGATDLRAIAHRFEDLLGAAHRSGRVLTPETLRKLFRGLDVIRRLVDEAVTGQPSGVDVWKAIADLHADLPPVQPQPTPPALESAAASAQTAAGEPSAGEPSAGEPSAGEPSAGPIAGQVPSRSDAGGTPPEGRAGVPDPMPAARQLHIETIRVPASHLDALMTHAGELAVSRTRLARRVAQIEELLDMLDDETRDGGAAKTALRELGVGTRALPAVAVERLTMLQARSEARIERICQRLQSLHGALAEESAKLEYLSHELGEGIRGVRLLPLSTVFNLFPRMARDLARDQGKEISFRIEGGETVADKRIIEEVKDPLMHIIRNAIDHGIEPEAERLAAGKPAIASVLVRAWKTESNTVIEVSDDGRGLDVETIGRVALARDLVSREELSRMTPAAIQELIFMPGFSTRALITDLSGRGVGMDVVRTNVDKLKGTVAVESRPGRGTTIRLRLPATLATARMLIFDLDGHAYALPVESVRMVIRVRAGEIRLVEGRETIFLDGGPIPVAPLADLLELRGVARETGGAESLLNCVVISEREERFGLLVDQLLDEQELVLRQEGGLLRRVRNVSGAVILGSGKVCVILNPQDLLKSIRSRTTTHRSVAEEPAAPAAVLLVEDSITTRTQMKRILEGAGYQVVTAVDGVDGLGKLGTRSFDAVISDVQMPHMDGLAMTAKIRSEARYADLPVILVTSLAREEDKRRGIEVGATAYLTKPTFDQKVLLDTLRRLI